MTLLYKLGDGPINYDWNPRYVSIESTEIFYSPQPNDRDAGKTINIYGGAVSNICKIKGKNFCFCITIPPPTNKSMYLAADTFEDAVKIRDKIVKATQNDSEEVYIQETDNALMISKNVNKLNHDKDSITHVGFYKSNYESELNSYKKYKKLLPEDFFPKLEELKNDIILNDTKFYSKFKNDLKISVPLKYLKYNYSSYFKPVILNFIKFFIIFYFANLIFSSYFLGSSYITILIEIGLILYALVKFKSKLYLRLLQPKEEKCDYIVKSSMIIEGDRSKIVDVITNANVRYEWDFFIRNRSDITLNNVVNNEIFFTGNIKFSLPYNFFLNQFTEIPHIEHKIEMIKYSDEQDNNYILFREKNVNRSNYINNNFFELFVLVPIKDVDEVKTLVIFLTNFDYTFNNGSIYGSKAVELPYFARQILKEERLNILTSLREYILVNDVSLSQTEKLATVLKIKNMETLNKTKTINLLDEDQIQNNYIHATEYMETVRSLENENNLEINQESRIENDDREKIEINPKSILARGRRIPLEDRFPGYLKNPEGGVECRNYEELSAQEGIILEVMKRAGKQLIEGKNIIGVSLPVRIFEPRSTLTRLCDHWGTGGLYLNKAASCTNPVERMKNVIAFSISGIHMGMKMLKPFNPILGETYEGAWPDGTKLYLEHMSHHPPISRFLIVAGNKKWRFYGYYEYVVKLKSLAGNSMGGYFRGPNIVEFFNDSTKLTDHSEESTQKQRDTITFNFPNMNIHGTMYGRRLVEWEGEVKFLDQINNISASYLFTPAPKFYQSFKEPHDLVRGEIKHYDKIVSKIFGSPIDRLLIDDKL